MGWIIEMTDAELFGTGCMRMHIDDDGRITRTGEMGLLCRLTPDGRMMTNCGASGPAYLGRFREGDGAVMDANGMTVCWVHSDGSIRDAKEDDDISGTSRRLGEIRQDGEATGFVAKMLKTLAQFRGSREQKRLEEEEYRQKSIQLEKKVEDYRKAERDAKEAYRGSAVSCLKLAAVFGIAALATFAAGLSFIGGAAVIVAVAFLIVALADWGSSR